MSIALTEKRQFAALDLFADLSANEVEAVGDISKRVHFKGGEVIMREGETGDSMYLFIDGQVNVSKELTIKIGKAGFSQAEKSMVKLKAGSSGIFGDMAMFGDEPRSASITADSDCVLYQIKRGDFEALCLARPELGVKVLKRIAAVLCSRLRSGNADVLKLSTALSIALSK